MTDTLLGIASLTVIGTAGVLWFQRIQRVAIPANRGVFIAVWLVALTLGVAALLGEPGWIGGVPASLGVLGAAFFLATVAIGGQKVGEGAITVGATIPAFTALDEHGTLFDSQSLAGHPALIKFFRGHW